MTGHVQDLWALTREAVRTFPARFVIAAERWYQRAHDPDDYNGQPFCFRCGTAAPCDEWMDAAERISEARRAL